LLLSLMLTGLRGGGLMLEHQKSAAAAQPHQHPSFLLSELEAKASAKT
jgi:hypothetical protein